MEPDPQWYLDNVLAFAEPGRLERVPRDPVHAWQAWWQRQWSELDRDPPSVLAREQGFVLSTRQLRAFGWDDHDLRRGIRRGEWIAPVRGVASPVVAGPTKDPLVAARRRHAVASTAAALLRPGQVVSCRSDAILHGLPTLAVPTRPELTAAPPKTLGHRGRAHVYSATLSTRDVTTWFGTPVTRPARTVVDEARHDRRDGLMAADAALRAGLLNPAQLRATLASSARWPGVRQAREVSS
jgi:hypothetical protein